MNHRGSLLVMTLWIVMILSTLSVAIARYLSTDLRLIKYRVARSQARALAHSGVFLAMELLTNDGEGYDWLGDEWAYFPSDDLSADTTLWTLDVPIESASEDSAPNRIEIRITDQQRKLNLNNATSETIQKLFDASGVSYTITLPQAIIDHFDQDGDGESSSDEPVYYQKNSPIAVMEELREIPDMTEAAYEALKEYTVAYTMEEAPDTLNINTVSLQVLQVIGADLSLAQSIDQARDGLDDVPGSGDDCIVENMETAATTLAACTQQEETDLVELLGKAQFIPTSSVFHVTAEAVLQRPSVRYKVEAVVQRAEAATANVLSWREQL